MVVRADPTVRQRIRVGAFEHAALEAAAPIAVDERVHQDANEPRPQVGAGLELLSRVAWP